MDSTDVRPLAGVVALALLARQNIYLITTTYVIALGWSIYDHKDLKHAALLFAVSKTS
jgi:hypothetical protein